MDVNSTNYAVAGGAKCLRCGKCCTCIVDGIPFRCKNLIDISSDTSSRPVKLTSCRIYKSRMDGMKIGEVNGISIRCKKNFYCEEVIKIATNNRR